MHILTPNAAPAPQIPEGVSPAILDVLRAAGVTAQDVAPFVPRHPEFAPYAVLLEPTP